MSCCFSNILQCFSRNYIYSVKYRDLLKKSGKDAVRFCPVSGQAVQYHSFLIKLKITFWLFFFILIGFQLCFFQVSHPFSPNCFWVPYIYVFPYFLYSNSYLLASCRAGCHAASPTVPVSNRICKVGLVPALNPAEGSSENSNYRHRHILHDLDVASFQFFCILACLHCTSAS